jgi:hypothetical protein
VDRAYSGGLGGLGVRLAAADAYLPAAPACRAGGLPSTRPLTFGDLGGDCRRDRGVGVAGGEEELDLPDLIIYSVPLCDCNLTGVGVKERRLLPTNFLLPFLVAIRAICVIVKVAISANVSLCRVVKQNASGTLFHA